MCLIIVQRKCNEIFDLGNKVILMIKALQVYFFSSYAWGLQVNYNHAQFKNISQSYTTTIEPRIDSMLFFVKKVFVNVDSLGKYFFPIQTNDLSCIFSRTYAQPSDYLWITWLSQIFVRQTSTAKIRFKMFACSSTKDCM